VSRRFWENFEKAIFVDMALTEFSTQLFQQLSLVKLVFPQHKLYVCKYDQLKSGENGFFSSGKLYLPAFYLKLYIIAWIWEPPKIKFTIFEKKIKIKNIVSVLFPIKKGKFIGLKNCFTKRGNGKRSCNMCPELVWLHLTKPTNTRDNLNLVDSCSPLYWFWRNVDEITLQRLCNEFSHFFR